jgi:hypothetical protein
VASQLQRNGYAVDTLEPALAGLVAATLREASGFFDAIDDLPAAVRQTLCRRQPDGRAALFTGFRMPGEEYAQAYERPDMMQSFSIMAADRVRLPAEVWDFLREHPYTGRLFAIREAIIAHATRAMAELAELLGARKPLDVDLSSHTFLQVNSYRPNLFEGRYGRPGQTPLHQRQFLQDPHEDGQFLTWAAADDWGLVGRARREDAGELAAVEPSPARMLVMPSLPFTYFTGGPQHGGIPPFEHAVLREFRGRPITGRTSLICFVNPDVTRELPVLVPSRENTGVSIPLLVNEAQWRFGLPRYEDSTQVAADGPARRHTNALLDRLYGSGKN